MLLRYDFSDLRRVSLALVGFDEAETPLFHIDREMAKSSPSIAFHAEIGTITNPDCLERVMKRYHPTILYHAAAYKHVPLMEKHVFAAVETNIFGTWNGSSRQGCESCKVKVLAPSITCIRTASISGACGGNDARSARM
jgi:FlaA1/EpsC-like NDP-sugar epimerase